MANGYKDFVNLTALLEVDLDDYLMKQTLMKFATGAARDAALAAVLREGMASIQDDTNSITVYSGATWSTIGPVHGAWTTYTPVVTQSGAVTLTNTDSRYIRIGRLIIGHFIVALTGAGTGANDVTVTIPVAAAGGNANYFVGTGKITDASVPTEYAQAELVLSSTTTVKFLIKTLASGLTFLGTTSFTAALASGDGIAGAFWYEAGADA